MNQNLFVCMNYVNSTSYVHCYCVLGMLADAVDLYTKKGMNKEALQCAQKSQDKNAIGQSLVLDSKIRLSQYKDFNDIEEEVKNEICENLNQAFYSLQDLENKLAAGEAALLTGELTGRTEFINKAFGAFSKSRPRSEIGQLECMHWMVHNSNLYERENLRKCVLGMQNLFVNLFVLAKHNTEKERNRLQEIFKFFGFYPAEEENKLVYYPKQQPRALLVMSNKNREVFRCKEDKDKIREKIFKFLEERGVVWKKKLEKVIIDCRNKNKQCPAIRLGETCKNSQDENSDGQTCPFLHAPLKPKKFDLLTEYDMLAIELEVHIHHGAEDVRAMEPDFDKEGRFISNELEERYKACSWLLEDLIPQNYHNAIISSGPERSRDLIKKLRYSKYVKKRMIRYLKGLFDKMEKFERKDNIKVFVMIRFVIPLLNLEMKPKLDDLMSRFEDSMNKECSRKERRRKKEWAMKLGLMIDDSDGKTYVRSIARRFCDGYEEITGMNNNPSEALIQFTKFCALLSNTGSVEVLPHYNQLLLWMEYFTTVAFCLTAKVQNTPSFFFVIPNSYIAVVYFIDSTFVQERGVPTFEAVQRHRMWKSALDTKLFQDRLKKMVEIICGLTSDTKINLLSLIFQSNNPDTPITHEAYGIAERLLVLVLVLVCNLGKSVYPMVETKLMSELCKIKVWEEYPSRLSEALKSVQQAGSPAEVAKALQVLLSKRENDSLGYCIWDNSDRRNGLRTQELKAKELSKKFFLEEETLQAMNNPHDIVSSKPRTEIDEDDEMDTPISMEEKMEIDRIRKEKERSEKENKARKIIDRVIRRFIFCSKAKKLSERVKRQISIERKEEKLKVFNSIQITNTVCGICGVQFKERSPGFLFPVDRQTSNDSESSGLLQPPSPLQLPQPNHEMVQQIQTTPSPDKVMDNPFASLLENHPMFMSQKSFEDANQETREEHEKSEKHKEMVKFYQHFRLKYMQEISDPFREVRDFMQRYKLGSAELVEKHFKEETYNIGILRRQRESVENKIENIIKGCEWQNGEIWGEVQEMIGSYHLIKDYVETEARKRKEVCGFLVPISPRIHEREVDDE